MMDRVTYRDGHGHILIVNKPKTRGDALTMLLQRCAAYEDLELEPEEIAEKLGIKDFNDNRHGIYNGED